MKILISNYTDPRIGETGMYYHRIKKPFEHLTANYSVQAEVTPSRIKEIESNKLQQYDAVMFSRNVETNGTGTATINYLHSLGLKVIIDIDDYWHVDSNHSMFKGNKEANIGKQVEMELSYADLIFTPTPFLTEAVRRLNNNTFTIKTCLSKESQWTTTKTESNLTRFGWIGGIHHLVDIKILEKSFKKVYEKCTQDKFQLCVGGFNARKQIVTHGGQLYEAHTNNEYIEIEKIFTSNYKNIKDEDYKKYLLEYTSVAEHISYFKNYRRLWAKDIDNYGNLYNDIDIALVPLNSTGLFNQYKSELKLIEAGTKGKMAIVSRVKPYNLLPDEVVHFIDPSDLNGWYKAIKYCLANPSYVQEKSALLKAYIEKYYVMEEQNDLRYNLIKRVCETVSV